MVTVQYSQRKVLIRMIKWLKNQIKCKCHSRRRKQKVRTTTVRSRGTQRTSNATSRSLARRRKRKLHRTCQACSLITSSQLIREGKLSLVDSRINQVLMMQSTTLFQKACLTSKSRRNSGSYKRSVCGSKCSKENYKWSKTSFSSRLCKSRSGLQR